MPYRSSAAFLPFRTVLGIVACLSAAAMLYLPSSAAALDSCDPIVVDKTWEGDVSSNWHTPGNWSPATVPNTTQDLCIPAATPNAPVISSGTQANSNSIESSQPITVNAGTLRIVGTGGQTSLLHDDLSFADGTTLNNTSSLTVQGDLTWRSNTIQGAGTTTIAPAGTLSLAGGDFASRVLDTQTLHIDGTGTGDGVANGSTTALQNGAELEIGSGGSLTLGNNNNLQDNGGGTNEVQVLAGGTLAKGTGGGVANVGLPLENDGTVGATAGELDLNGNAATNSSTGLFSASTGTIIDFSGGTQTIGDGGGFGGQGTVQLSGATVNLAGNTSAAGSTTLTQTGGFLDNAGSLTVSGAYNWNFGTIQGAGTTTIGPTGTLSLGGGDFAFRVLDTQTLHIDGTGTEAGVANGSTTGLQNGAELEIGSGGSLTLGNNNSLQDFGGGTNEVQVLAGGTLAKGTGAGTATVGVPVDNAGKLEAIVGTLALTSSLANYNQTTDRLSGGEYVVRAGATLKFNDPDSVDGVRNNSADITLDGAGSQIQDQSNQNMLRNFNVNEAAGKLRLRNGRNYSRVGSFTNNGLIDLAQTTRFTTTQAYTQGAGGTLETDIAGTVAGTSYGQVSANTSANVNGTLDVDATYVPQTGDVFDVVTAGTTRTGQFATENADGFEVNYLSDRVRLTAPTLRVFDRKVTEGNAGTLTANFRVTLSSPSDGAVTVDYATSDLLAKSPGDYQATTGTVNFSPGQTQKFIPVTVNGDTLDEANETYRVTLSNPSLANIGDGIATGRITDDDPPPTISIADAPNRPEGGSQHVFDVTLSGPSGRRVKVDYTTTDGTAVAPGDYEAKSGTLTFLPNQTTKTIRVSNVNDLIDEPNETFTVDLSNPVFGTIADGSGQTTIIDND